VRALFVGDVVGGEGMRALLALLPRLRREHEPDLVVVNAENAAAGSGTSPRQARDLLDAGVDVLTGGNHTLRRRELYPVLATEPRVLRPANIAVRAPGHGMCVVPAGAGRAAVINVMGAVFMTVAESPFAVIEGLVEAARAQTPHVFVDLHAEATSEKIAMAHHLAGRVTAVVGTHTHVQTADARILRGGTAAVTDLGMTGPHDSVLGVRAEIVLDRFLTGAPARFETAEDGVLVQGAVVEADPDGRAKAIRTFSEGV
jgi:2',3'-cyclic-nucleotide 2'-phosphodiesterase